ncbi:STAS/SEC14 domain-containing protein [Polyangium jinanense]|uniref:STAS/SEC14 domain-containing protein n=1 Tax=Polyangium jinanense TaxID=2829994 RepID=A0A9X4AXB0_9BACT|nr:STAS/SEC14 domain-containing protein [Polyangium jinanense]MDC3959479.1 STAS/SEC14 domain-containing protein [Polyangium jinanense]MDC3986077.1 STAS/SEC14 domain-containing protein [Polyangium jinanense]
MFQIKLDKLNTLIEFSIEGLVQVDEMKQFLAELRRSAVTLTGSDLKIFADMRKFRPASPNVVEEVREVHELAKTMGVRRLATVLESEVLALHMSRLARETGADKFIRRFTDEQEAREWLATGESLRKSRRLP